MIRDLSRSISTTLLQKLRGREESAFVRLQSLFAGTVVGRLQRLGIPRDDLDDQKQEVFLRVWKGLPRFRREQPTDSFRRWILTIVRNVAMDYHQAPQRLSADSDLLQQLPAVDSDDARTQELAMELHQMLNVVRRDFSEVTFSIFMRFWFDGHDTEQIAKDLGMRKGTVREARNRVLRRLREEFAELYDESTWPFSKLSNG
jgi:RNA polymerase sigma-70 factor (ECF subfamily)